jgi:hypothetical protein
MKEEGTVWKKRKMRSVNIIHIFFAPNIVRIIKSKMMRWVGHITRLGENNNIYRSFGGKTWSKKKVTVKECA